MATTGSAEDWAIARHNVADSVHRRLDCRGEEARERAEVGGEEAEEWEINLLQTGCKPGCLQPLTKKSIGLTCRPITQLKRYWWICRWGLSTFFFCEELQTAGLQQIFFREMKARRRGGEGEG
jgi:hypothetical protein